MQPTTKTTSFSWTYFYLMAADYIFKFLRLYFFQRSSCTQWNYQFLNAFTYQLQRTTTSCWFWWRGRDAASYVCGTDPCHSSSPNICWHRYVQLPELRNSTVRIRQRRDAHTTENHLRQPSSCPSRRCESSDRVHHDRTVTWGTACFCSSGSWKRVAQGWITTNIF